MEVEQVSLKICNRNSTDNLYCATSLPLSAGGGFDPSNQIFKKGAGFDMTSTFRGGCWERGGDFFQGGRVAIFTKNEIKSEIFNGKKGL